MMHPVGPRLLPGPVRSLTARVAVPPSKSVTNRALVAAAAAGGGVIRRPLDCEDTRLLAAALAAAGWEVDWSDAITVGAHRPPKEIARLNLGNSGTGARLILALLAGTPGRYVVDGTARLRERPMAPLVDALEALGGNLTSADGALPVALSGRPLEGGPAVLRPGPSSQFVSALLLAAPAMRRGLDLRLEGPLPSRPYLDLTEDAVVSFGGAVSRSGFDRRWQVAPVPLRPTTVTVEGDWSAAAFFLGAAALVPGVVDLGPVRADSRQGDRRLATVLAAAGLTVEHQDDRVIARGPVTDPVAVDLEATPDLFPVLATVAAFAPPGSCLSGLGNLRHKESDRLAVMVENLTRLGAAVEVDGDLLRVIGVVSAREDAEPLAVTAAGDHRIAMAMAAAALRCGPLELDDPDCVVKSFPDFWQQWRAVVGGLPSTG